MEEEETTSAAEDYQFAKLMQPFSDIPSGGELRAASVNVQGQIVVKRLMGKKLCFMDLQHQHEPARLQLRLLQSVFDEEAAKTNTPPENLSALCGRIKVGDIAAVEGFPERTNSGCLSLTARSVTILQPWQGDPLVNSFAPKRRSPEQSAFYVSQRAIQGERVEEGASAVPPLCKLVRKGRTHDGDQVCPYRHFFIDEAEKKLVEHYQEQKALTRMQFHDSEDPFVDKMPKSARARVFASWLVKRFGAGVLCSGTGVVDVAGGKGFLSFELAVRGVDSTLIEPRAARLSKRQYKFLKKSSIPSFKQVQTLFNEQLWILDSSSKAEGEGMEDVAQSSDPPPRPSLRELRTDRKSRGVVIESPAFGQDIVLGCSVVVGLHPDQATEVIVDYALTHNKPFAVVPCCVFPALFPDRKTPTGGLVTTYEQFIEYLKGKDSSIQIDYLDMEGRNKVLYRT